MTFFWKIATPVASVALICGAAITWQVFKAKANERELADDARITRISADQGDAKSESKLGRMYYYGQGVPQDYAEAIRWYRKAADQGEARAQYDIGYLYDKGEGVSQDYIEALVWYRRAADQGDAHAIDAIGSAYYFGHGQPQDYGEAVRWYRLAADKGSGKAQYNLGYLYYHGQGVLQDRAEADQWYRKAADQGDERAQRALGLRGNGLSPWGVIVLSAMFLGFLFPLKDSLFSGQSDRSRQPRAVLLAEVTGFVWIGLRLYGAFGVFQSVLVVHAFYFVEGLVIGMTGAMFISAVGPRATKIALCVSGLLLFGANLFMVAHRDRWPVIAVTRALYSAEGFLFGVCIALAILLWLTYRKSRGQSS